MILFFLACKPPETNGAPHPVDFEIPLTELEDIVNRSFESGLPSMLDMNSIYEEMMSWGDTVCPSFTPYVNGIEGHWADDCTAANGTHFFGFSQYYDVENSLHEDGSQMGTIWGSFETLRPDGQSIQVGGTASLRISSDLGIFTQMFQGTFSVLDSAAWLEGGSQNYIIDGVLNEKTTLSGGVQYPDIVLNFNDLLYHPESCGDGIGIQGELQIRDRSGYWFSIERTGCTPCSDLFWGEKNLGEFCIWQSLDSAITDYLFDIEALMSP